MLEDLFSNPDFYKVNQSNVSSFIILLNYLSVLSNHFSHRIDQSYSSQSRLSFEP